MNPIIIFTYIYSFIRMCLSSWSSKALPITGHVGVMAIAIGGQSSLPILNI
jgi:hypothetical protein